MSNFEQKEGQGSLFKNEKKTAPNQPDYRGELKWHNQLLKVAGWIKESKTGKKFLSLKVEAIDTTSASFKPEGIIEKPRNNDDLPF
jgi:uncharacterized protein (DUF736 family)